MGAPPNLAGGSLLVAARRSGEKTLALAAMGNADIVTAKTDGCKTNLHNGVHWYCKARKSIGFSPSEVVHLNNADDEGLESHERLSWRLDGYGGWRVGATVGLF